MEQSLVERGWMGWETCVALGLHYCRAAVHFTVARQRLTLCNRIVCQRVSHCANVCSMGWERVGGWGAVGWGGGDWSDWSVVKNKPLAIITGNGLRHPLLCLVATHLPLSVYLSHCCHISCSFDPFFLFSAFFPSLSPPLPFFLFPKIAFSFTFSLHVSLQSWSVFATLFPPCEGKMFFCSVSHFRPQIFPFSFPLHVSV